MECWKSSYLPWKTIVLLLIEMWYGMSWWRIISPIPSNFVSLLEVDEQDRWFQQDGVVTHSKFNSTNVVQILWWPYCFFKLVVLLISRSNTLDLCIWGFLKENNKNSLHVRRNETEYSAVNFKHHWRNLSPGCIKLEEEWMHALLRMVDIFST